MKLLFQTLLLALFSFLPIHVFATLPDSASESVRIHGRLPQVQLYYRNQGTQEIERNLSGCRFILEAVVRTPQVLKPDTKIGFVSTGAYGNGSYQLISAGTFNLGEMKVRFENDNGWSKDKVFPIRSTKVFITEVGPHEQHMFPDFRHHIWRRGNREDIFHENSPLHALFSPYATEANRNPDRPLTVNLDGHYQTVGVHSFLPAHLDSSLSNYGTKIWYHYDIASWVIQEIGIRKALLGIPAEGRKLRFRIEDPSNHAVSDWIEIDYSVE